jgi:hypothetical protein
VISASRHGGKWFQYHSFLPCSVTASPTPTGYGRKQDPPPLSYPSLSLSFLCLNVILPFHCLFSFHLQPSVSFFLPFVPYFWSISFYSLIFSLPSVSSCMFSTSAFRVIQSHSFIHFFLCLPLFFFLFLFYYSIASSFYSFNYLSHLLGQYKKQVLLVCNMWYERLQCTLKK